jgi:hypothetical protein
MTAPITVSELDLRTLVGIVSDHRPDVPAKEGLPPSLLADLMGQIRCDVVAFAGFDSAREETWSSQFMRDGGEAVVGNAKVNWQYYWHCQVCSHPDRTGDLRSIVTIADFYSARQWHSIGTRCGINQPLGSEHALMLTLPATPGPVPDPGRTIRLYLLRGSGPDFSERDRALLTLLRRTCTRPIWMPSATAASSPGSPPGSGTCCAWSRPGTPTPRSPGGWASPRAPCAPIWKASTKRYRSPAVPPQSPAPFRTGLCRVLACSVFVDRPPVHGGWASGPWSA